MSTRTSTGFGDTILRKLRGAMGAQNLDVLLVMAPENIVYVAGVVPPSLRSVRTRLACCVVPAEGATEMVVVALEKGAVETLCRLDAVTPYREFEQDAVSVATGSLKDRGLADGVIGIESTYLPKESFDLLQESLPGARFVPVDDLLSEVRAIKTPEEIEHIDLIGQAAQQIGEESLRLVSAGDSETKLGDFITERYTEAGGRLTMLVVGAGERSALPNAVPSDRHLERGDVVRIDVIGNRENYCSDVARTAVVGEPSADQLKLYATLKEIYDRIIDRVRPGALTSDLYEIYRDGMEREGLPYYHFVGHGLGITLHEEPFMGTTRPMSLVPNMVLCIEPMCLLEGRYGMQIEDEVLVTSDGCRLITSAGDLLQIDA